MSAVETDENEIHFNLSLLTKILQQYVGGGKLLPLRPTQTILVSCVRFILQKKKKHKISLTPLFFFFFFFFFFSFFLFVYLFVFFVSRLDHKINTVLDRQEL